MQRFLQATEYIDYNSEIIQNKAMELFNDNMSNVEKARIAYEFVRDEIPHSFDCNAKIITAKAS
ncbi:MAG: transglutaminase, partial [Clostridia bacterium]|nr:transglutaminase [Clostridia bacterium]